MNEQKIEPQTEPDFGPHHRDCEWHDDGSWFCHPACLQQQVWALEARLERIADLTQPLQARLARNGYYEAASQCADIIALAMGADPR